MIHMNDPETVASYQTCRSPDVVRSIRQFLELLNEEQIEPILSDGISLFQNPGLIRQTSLLLRHKITYLRPVGEYTLTVPSCMAAAQNVVVAVNASTGDGR